MYAVLHDYSTKVQKYIGYHFDRVMQGKVVHYMDSSMYTVSRKRDPDIIDCNFGKD